MREIKFRAWLPNEKKIHPVTEINFMDGGRVEVEYFPWRVKYIPKSDYELMQYTGLKDKNGKEIYEGDIVIVTHATGYGGKSTKYKDFTTEIYFDDYEASFKAKWPENAGKFRFRNHSLAKCEVIGNIYETPDLLEGIS